MTQMLRPNEKTRSHRHTSTSIYHVFRGGGTTLINGKPFHWQKGDTFIVPLWAWHEHANASSIDDRLVVHREQNRFGSDPLSSFL